MAIQLFISRIFYTTVHIHLDSVTLHAYDASFRQVRVVAVAGFPLAVVYKLLFQGKSASSQHVFFTVCGLGIGYFNFGGYSREQQGWIYHLTAAIMGRVTGLHPF